MSSPSVPPYADYPDRRVASSPAPSTVVAAESQEPSIRPMRLKILYTFDDANKTNCLARWPQILNIRTAHLDETTQVGVIELKTCIQAIVTASPELVAKLGQDYTVYAYDYSEYETPLVGQGMLSWVLASASTTPSAPAHQSSTVVTGRVCKNILGLFGNGIQETLEVKLRLVPVPTCLQSEYIESMRKYRDLSRIMPEGFDAQSWTEFLKANPNILSVADQRSQSPACSSVQSQVGIEHVQRLMTDGYGPQSGTTQSTRHRRDSYSASMVSGQETVRSGSPTPSIQSIGTQQPIPQYTRTASRASSRTDQSQFQWSQGNNPTELGYTSNDERQDEGPTRKRAKIMKADHPGKSVFGKKKDSLRVTASTAASIRVFQPTAMRPTGNPAQSLEGPPRVPTPIPQSTGQGRRPLLPKARSGLSQASLMTSDSGYKSPYALSDDMPRRPNSVATSPEMCRMTHSPEDPASSPPVMRAMSAAPSSPVLPALPQHEDSGFMSANLDELFGEDDEDEDRLPNEEDAEIAAQYQMRPELEAAEPGVEASLQPSLTEDDVQIEAQEARRREISMRNALKAIGVKRSQTWSGDQQSSEPSSRRPSLARGESAGTKNRPKEAWNKEKRRAAIEAKLKTSIEAGQLPPFCENCGSIETPTWRKAYSRIHSGDHKSVTLSNKDGGIVAFQILETNEDGSTKLFKIFKKSKVATDEGYADVLLCNPCGIWLSNHKSMRPETHWVSRKKPKAEKAKEERPKRGRARKRRTDSAGANSDVLNAPSEAISMASEASMAPFTFGEPVGQANVGHVDETDQPELPPLKKAKHASERASSPPAQTKSETTMEPAAIAALQRAIQSSPGRFLGSKQSPIEVDKQSPDPARRSLFSSPKTAGPLGISAGEGTNGTPKRPKTLNDTLKESTDTTTTEEEADKENLPPQPSTPNSLDDLFSDFPLLTPSRSDALVLTSPLALPFKTPCPRDSPHNKHPINTGDFFSSAAKAFLHPPRTPNRTPSKLNKLQAPSLDLEPFTRHLTQIMSDPTNSDANANTTNHAPLGSSPSRFLNELANLPDMGAVPHLNDGGTPSRMFRSGDFDFGDFPSSDAAALPSSPPGWFGVYEDPVASQGLWDLGFGSSPAKAGGGAGADGVAADADVVISSGGLGAALKDIEVERTGTKDVGNDLQVETVTSVATVATVAA